MQRTFLVLATICLSLLTLHTANAATSTSVSSPKWCGYQFSFGGNSEIHISQKFVKMQEAFTRCSKPTAYDPKRTPSIVAQLTDWHETCKSAIFGSDQMKDSCDVYFSCLASPAPFGTDRWNPTDYCFTPGTKATTQGRTTTPGTPCKFSSTTVYSKETKQCVTPAKPIAQPSTTTSPPTSPTPPTGSVTPVPEQGAAVTPVPGQPAAAPKVCPYANKADYDRAVSRLGMCRTSACQADLTALVNNCNF